MSPYNGTDPGQFIVDFFGGFERAVTDTEEELGTIVDRFHTSDMVQYADGHRMDRAKLIAHLRPVRKKKPRSRLEVHEATADGDLLAARYTMHVVRSGRSFSIDVHYFGRFAPDGRLREAHQLTRMEKNPAGARDNGKESAEVPA
ncbi:nuclear transport factor 2 family protein [Nocardiopsis nanhaiensis]